MTRLELTDTRLSSAVKMSEGYPGAARVCSEMLRDGGKIDSDAFFGGFGGLISMDMLGIYGSRIWMLYKYVCGHDLVKSLGLLRANQLGYLSASDLNHAIDNYGDGVDVDALLSQVRERLPSFGLIEAESA